MRIEDNILKGEGGDIKFVGSPNHSDGMSPLYLVLHYTAGSSLDGAVSWLTNPKAKASAHLVIGRGGEVVQLVRFDKKAWHAGVSLWGKLKNMNNFSIGIELVNQGKLVRKGGKWVDYSDRVVADSDVIEAVHKNERYPAGWQTYTQKQVDQAIDVAKVLHEKFNFQDILGHEDIAPDRKVDPGPAFNLNRFRSLILGRMDE